MRPNSSMKSLSAVTGHLGVGPLFANRELRATAQRIIAGHQAFAAVDLAPAARTKDLHASEPRKT